MNKQKYNELGIQMNLHQMNLHQMNLVFKGMQIVILKKSMISLAHFFIYLTSLSVDSKHTPELLIYNLQMTMTFLKKLKEKVFVKKVEIDKLTIVILKF